MLQFQLVRLSTKAPIGTKPLAILRSNHATHFRLFHTAKRLNFDRKPLFEKILIANRGEIALRVMRTAKDLGIKTVAVYSEADVNAQHVKMADEAFLIGPAPSAESYLCIDKIIDAAKITGAQAIHPGYGFLSENADFADTVKASNIEFIGPSGDAMRAMGSKSESKYIMQDAGVPVVPGYHGENQDPKFLKEQAAKIGYPVLIKAIKGGGGKGMRIVQHPDDFEEMLASSKRESLKHFADDKVLVEKYLERPRHVEVQVFADKHGNYVHLFERDCSVQRRHQKVIEEAPAPGLSQELRMELGAKAVAAARAVNYVNAGTVEFIMDNVDKQFYFMEMNTRLQVEHPVTEMVTNTDLVRWQLEVAAGNPLPMRQEDLKLSGHAFEARVYAENPSNHFLPDTGPLFNVRTPTPSPNLRLETGFIQGDDISVYYDPMISKLVVHGEDRQDALRRFRRALEQYQIVGLNTNIGFIKTVAEHPEFIKGEVETGFIQQYEKDLFRTKGGGKFEPDPSTLALAASALRLKEIESVRKSLQDPYNPWATRSDSFRINNLNHKEYTVTTKEDDHPQPYKVVVSTHPENDSLIDMDVMNGETGETLKSYKAVKTYIDQEDGLLVSSLDNKKLKSNVVLHNDEVVVFDEFGRTTLKLPTPKYLEGLRNSQGTAGAAGSIKTPMPCKISQILVQPGQHIKKGDTLIVLEAMKMEHVIKAPMAGKVDQVLYAVGDLVAENKSLLTFADKEEPKAPH
ncbi:carbamoyl-phosphate synthase L chain, ATP binding domain-containing protein [Mycotypha africana]|uniref:carbamoyl-phosphate synthase L chain, ATP binding domain-containing protein n=1 Tax=Mycotypha africana TaxID=64632 RepID=UPI002301E3C1|nr:carbamoyl-phosphate synthase L chain, ATP binding domain-containing protein [Mycotypha africana]KAI8971513.1 carbamoyl-phosphate synthase L chain, ATP binding domain-containing protein [Mycotypha africana]